ncbi:hypothetical protein [Mucilaginibacter psychrotolerans]|uniref:Uncharacterized protein n=1 Tax=Mucilaginibacter psychrotolerans TaxID=1524096 RepID=A0A4Y8SG41_9SPHI|nr:hypothetical protein [Mucilaginibacter psychrotolerans]TFF38023.1 hypothetical protein E2R66_10595 [Mucilaginibacter psychrotolerans]
MFETVSVGEALARGKRMVTYPVYFIQLVPPAITIWLFIQFQFNGWLTTGIVVLSFIAAWLYWSVAIPKWRLWAFANVRNVHQLKSRAIKEKLIWPDGSIFNKTEIWSASRKLQWASLQHKFDKEDVLENQNVFDIDLLVPPQIEIYYAKTKAFGNIVVGAGLVAAGIFLYGTDDLTWLAWSFIVVGLGLAVMAIRHLSNRTPQLTLSNDGVKLANNQFYYWVDIAGENTKLAPRGLGDTAYFYFSSPDGYKEIDISELDIKPGKLMGFLHTYRARCNKRYIGKTRFNTANDV